MMANMRYRCCASFYRLETSPSPPSPHQCRQSPIKEKSKGKKKINPKPQTAAANYFNHPPPCKKRAFKKKIQHLSSQWGIAHNVRSESTEARQALSLRANVASAAAKLQLSKKLRRRAESRSLRPQIPATACEALMTGDGLGGMTVAH